MIYINLPEKARERKTIVFMEDYQLELLKLDKNNKWMEDPNVCVLEYPDENIPEDYPILENEIYLKLKDKGFLIKNEPCVLVQYPYDTSDYTKPNENNFMDFINSNALKKYTIFKNFVLVWEQQELYINRTKKNLNLFRKKKVVVQAKILMQKLALNHLVVVVITVTIQPLQAN